jgi:hypothetical protein
VSANKITRKTLSLDELAALMGYTRGEKIVAIDYRTEAGGLVVIAEHPEDIEPTLPFTADALEVT